MNLSSSHQFTKTILLSFFFGGILGGAVSACWKGYLESADFWILILKLSLFETAIAFVAIVAFRHYLYELAKNEEECKV